MACFHLMDPEQSIWWNHSYHSNYLHKHTEQSIFYMVEPLLPLKLSPQTHRAIHWWWNHCYHSNYLHKHTEQSIDGGTTVTTQTISTNTQRVLFKLDDNGDGVEIRLADIGTSTEEPRMDGWSLDKFRSVNHPQNWACKQYISINEMPTTRRFEGK